MADESVSTKKTMLGEKGLAKLVSLVLKALGEGSGGDESKGDYLPLSGGTLTGNLMIADSYGLVITLGELYVRGGNTNIYSLNVRGEITLNGQNIRDVGSLKCDGGLSVDGETELNALRADGAVNLTGNVFLYQALVFSGEGHVEGDANFKNGLIVEGDLTANGKATFCGGTYIDKDGHIHLPSGVEIY